MLSPDTKITIIRSNRKTLSLQIKNGEIIVRAPLKMKDKEIYKFISLKKDWLEKHLTEFNNRQQELQNIQPFTDNEIKEMYKKAKEIIPERVKYYAPKVGVSYNRITIRCQKSRWGSCSSKGNLNFNCLLVLFPIEIIDSVVVHELCHRKHMNHSQQFYREIEKVFPDYKKWHTQLNQTGSVYLNKIPK